MPIYNPRDPMLDQSEKRQRLADLGVDLSGMDKVAGADTAASQDNFTDALDEYRRNNPVLGGAAVGRHRAIQEYLREDGLHIAADSLAVEDVQWGSPGTIAEDGYNTIRAIREGYRSARGDLALNIVRTHQDSRGFWSKAVEKVLGSEPSQIIMGGVEPLARAQQVLYGYLAGEGHAAWQRMFPKVVVEDPNGEHRETSQFAAAIDTLWTRITSRDDEEYQRKMDALRQANEVGGDQMLEFRDVMDHIVGEERMDQVYMNLMDSGPLGKVGAGALATTYALAEIFLDPTVLIDRGASKLFRGLRSMASSSYRATSAVRRAYTTNRMTDIMYAADEAERHLQNALDKFNQSPSKRTMKNLKNAMNLKFAALDHSRVQARGVVDTFRAQQDGVPRRRGLLSSVKARIAHMRTSRPDPALGSSSGWEQNMALRRHRGEAARTDNEALELAKVDMFGGRAKLATPLDDPDARAMIEIGDQAGVRVMFVQDSNLGLYVGAYSPRTSTLLISIDDALSEARRHMQRGNIPITPDSLNAYFRASMWETFLHEMQHSVFHNVLNAKQLNNLVSHVLDNVHSVRIEKIRKSLARQGYPVAKDAMDIGTINLVDETLARTIPVLFEEPEAWEWLLKNVGTETASTLLKNISEVTDRISLFVRNESLIGHLPYQPEMRLRRMLRAGLLRAMTRVPDQVKEVLAHHTRSMTESLDKLRAYKARLNASGNKNTPRLDASIEKLEKWILAIDEGNLDRIPEMPELTYEVARIMDTDEMSRLLVNEQVLSSLQTSFHHNSNVMRTFYESPDGDWVMGVFEQLELTMPIDQPSITKYGLPAGMKYEEIVDDAGNITRRISVGDRHYNMQLGENDIGFAMLTIRDLLDYLRPEDAKRIVDNYVGNAPVGEVEPKFLGVRLDKDVDGVVTMAISYARPMVELLATAVDDIDEVFPVRITALDSDKSTALNALDLSEGIRLIDENSGNVGFLHTRGFLSKRDPQGLAKQLLRERMDRIANGPDTAEIAASNLARIVMGEQIDDLMVMMHATPERAAMTRGRIIPGTVAGLVDPVPIRRYVEEAKKRAAKANMGLFEFDPKAAHLEEALKNQIETDGMRFDTSWLPDERQKFFDMVNDDWFNEYQETFFQRVGRSLDPDSWTYKGPSWLRATFNFMREPMRALEAVDPGGSWPILRNALYDMENEQTYLRAVFRDAMERFGALETKEASPITKIFVSDPQGASKTNEKMSALLFDLLDTPQGGEEFERLVRMNGVTDEQLKAVQDIRRELNLIGIRLGLEGTDKFIGANGYIHHAFDWNWHGNGNQLPENMGLSKKGNIFLAALLDRNGNQAPIRDAVAALDVYTRGVGRKLHLEPALLRFHERIKHIAATQPHNQWVLRYGEMLMAQLQGKPTILGTFVDNTIASIAAAAGRTYKPGTISRKIMGISSLIYSSLLAGNRRYPIMNIATSLATTSAQFGVYRTLKGLFRSATPEGQALFKAVNGDKLWRQIFEDSEFGNLLGSMSRWRIGSPSIQDTENFIRGMTFWAALDEMLTKGKFRSVAEADEAGVLGEILFDAMRTTEEVNHYFGVAGKPPALSRFTRSGSVVATQFLSFPFKQTEQLLSMAGENPGKIVDYLMVSGWISRVGAQELGIDLREYVGLDYLPQGPRDLTSPGVDWMMKSVRMMAAMSELGEQYGDPVRAQRAIDEWIQATEILVPLLGTRFREVARAAEIQATGTIGTPGLGYSRDVNVEFGPLGIPVPTGGKGSRSEAVGLITGAKTVQASLDAAARAKTQQIKNQAALERLALTDDVFDALRTGDAEELQKQLQRMAKLGFPIGDISTSAKARMEAYRLKWYVTEIRRNPGLAHKLVPMMDEYGILQQSGDDNAQ